MQKELGQEPSFVKGLLRVTSYHSFPVLAFYPKQTINKLFQKLSILPKMYQHKQKLHNNVDRLTDKPVIVYSITNYLVEQLTYIIIFSSYNYPTW